MSDFEAQFLYAAKNGKIERAERLLLDGSFDPSQHDNSIIQWACEKGLDQVVELLLKDSRVDPAANNQFCMQVAAFHGHTKVIDLLLRDYRCNVPQNHSLALWEAAQAGHYETVVLLVEHGDCDLDARNGGTSILEITQLNNHTSITEYLMTCIASRINISSSRICLDQVDTPAPIAITHTSITDTYPTYTAPTTITLNTLIVPIIKDRAIIDTPDDQILVIVDKQEGQPDYSCLKSGSITLVAKGNIELEEIRPHISDSESQALQSEIEIPRLNDVVKDSVSELNIMSQDVESEILIDNESLIQLRNNQDLSMVIGDQVSALKVDNGIMDQNLDDNESLIQLRYNQDLSMVMKDQTSALKGDHGIVDQSTIADTELSTPDTLPAISTNLNTQDNKLLIVIEGTRCSDSRLNHSLILSADEGSLIDKESNPDTGLPEISKISIPAESSIAVIDIREALIELIKLRDQYPLNHFKSNLANYKTIVATDYNQLKSPLFNGLLCLLNSSTDIPKESRHPQRPDLYQSTEQIIDFVSGVPNLRIHKDTIIYFEFKNGFALRIKRIFFRMRDRRNPIPLIKLFARTIEFGTNT